jgi:hypothetical protein
MIKLNSLLLFYIITLFSCGQNNNSKKTDNNIKSKEDTNTDSLAKQIFYDTSVIAILPIDTNYHWLFKNVTSVKLTNKDLEIVDVILTSSIKLHNYKQDTTKEFNEYIDLKKYKRQYVPFVNSKGEKKVYINCFCTSDWSFDNWKKSLVQVDDGGSCFFQVTINLTTAECEKLFTNGYA